MKEWTAQTGSRLDGIALEMATDIHRISGVIAPKDSRALVNSGRITRKGEAHYTVSYGGGSVPYARMRHYQNRKTPGSLRYLERAGETVSRNLKRYVKDI